MELEKNKKTIAKQIKRYRTMNRMTQKDLCDQMNDALGTSFRVSTLSSWENGVNSINSDYMPAFATIFNITLEELYGQDTNTFKENMLVIPGGKKHLTEEDITEIARFAEYIRWRNRHKEM